ncbi:MAG: acylphosphatase, partial [Acidobacteriota bacterium]
MNNCAPTSPSTATAGPVEPVRRLRLRVRGAVQGVGFRPYVYRLATELGLGGWVSNDPRGVSIEVAGPEEAVASFHRRLPAEGPPLAVIHDVTAEWPEPAEPPERSEASPGFRIETSETAGTKTAVVLPDAATCPACLAEVLDPADRRSGYPFTNCTHCGPRFTIVRALPYDRPNTTMARFRMCPRCRREYEDPLDRRFHAQPNACPDCGPRLALLDRRGEVVAGDPVETPVQIPLQSPDQALRAAAGALRDGKILALEGLGGFQLLVDARNPAAVAALRERKQR